MNFSFEEGMDHYTAPSLQAGMVESAERRLGVKLPRAYLEILRAQNGGVPYRRCFFTDFPTSWNEDHFAISAIRGIGGSWGIDAQVGGSRYLIEEWGYPDIGVVAFRTPSGGHDAVMLDYASAVRPDSPRIVYVDEDRVVRPVADSFEAFIGQLVRCEDCLDVARLALGQKVEARIGSWRAATGRPKALELWPFG
ncbi:SMI1/KNR4 family protein [Glycomyces tritici]|uniref:SMI1/KNR4 family protein n=1 Tax=Glycomyces tritici TaxID=2665176 RepID=A0ABT7YI20_9ACTN|nr:SMI1/KNR4 family protein [Glycomyces tritici]MDN3238245.1 SMI1/KNR4 family protein [Glycomyces tritici]